MRARNWVLATTNAGKVRELVTLFDESQLDIEVASLDVLAQTLGPIPHVEEDQDSFLGNAALKAKAYSLWSKRTVLADDSGLVVHALGGAPGVHSARYAVPIGASQDQDNIDKLLREMQGVLVRDAEFRCVLAVGIAGEVIASFEGVMRGSVTRAARGFGGFGYDPVFVPDGESRTLAEMSSHEKNWISHRGEAMRLLVEAVRNRDFDW